MFYVFRERESGIPLNYGKKHFQFRVIYLELSWYFSSSVNLKNRQN